MLRLIFDWFDTHPATYWVLTFPPTLILIGWIVLRAFRPSNPTAAASSPSSDRVFLLLLGGLLLAWRWPFLLAAGEYNPDESQLIAGALTLRHDPVFWRSVDGVTSGPLNSYVLLPVSWLGLPLDYFTARLTGLILTWFALLLVHRLLKSLLVPALAELGTLSLAILFATSTDSDLLQYSTEQLSVCLIALSACLLFRPTTDRPVGRLLGGGFVAGLLPWAKLQTVPIAGALLAWGAWQAWQHRQKTPSGADRFGWLLPWAGGVLPSLLTFAALGATGQLDACYRRYFLQSSVYVQENKPIAEALRHYAEYLSVSGHLPAHAAGALILIAGAAIITWIQARRPGGFYAGCALLTGAALLSVAIPRRPFIHYLLLVAVPAGLWLGAALHEWWKAGSSPAWRRGLILGGLLLTVLLPLGVRLLHPAPAILGHLGEHWRKPRSVTGNIVRAYAGPNVSLGVWGWLSEIYVDSGLRQATRDYCSYWDIIPSAQQSYYRQTYLSDLQRSRPAVFVDAVGPGSQFFSDRAAHGHETFPALAEYIRQNYQLTADLGQTRVYVRLDVLARHPRRVLELQHQMAAGRREFEAPRSPDAVLPASAAHDRIKGREVQMLLPPATLHWQLRGTEREVRLAYGFHPKAYTEGRTNGAEFIVELQSPGQPPAQVFRRLLDPSRQPSDRGEMTVRLVLPPVPPQTMLVVRTTAGEAGDTAWDWVYLAALQFIDSPFYLPAQFPGFNRTPDRIDAPYPFFVGTNPDRLLMLPAPTRLAYELDGSEHRLLLAFGFQEGAYTHDGQTDGAIYRVAWQRAAMPPQLLWERKLQPLGRPDDRGRQQADVTLPSGIRAGDRLLIQIDPGDSNSWDWTYIARLELL